MLQFAREGARVDLNHATGNDLLRLLFSTKMDMYICRHLTKIHVENFFYQKNVDKTVTKWYTQHRGCYRFVIISVTAVN